MRTGVIIGARTRVLVAALAVAVAGIPAMAGEARTPDAGIPAAASFRLADGSAGCTFLASGSLACAAGGATVVLDADGASRVVSQPLAWDAETPVLDAAASWWHGAYSCDVDAGAIVCRTSDGAITVGAGSTGGVR